MTLITEDSQVGDKFAGKPKTISWERLWAFSGGPFRLEGWPSSNIHTDPAWAEASKLPSVAASGSQFSGHLVEFVIDLLGLDFLSGGTMDVKFIGIGNAGDTLISNAEIMSKETEDAATKFTLDIYCENQNGKKIVVGSASGFIGTPSSLSPAEEWRKRRIAMETDSAINNDLTERPESEPLEYVVTPELNQQFCFGEEDFHPRYIEETVIGQPIAHPGLVINWANVTRSPSSKAQKGGGGLAARHEYFFCNPAKVGKKLRVEWKRIGSYEKRGRIYSIGDNVVVDEDGVDILRRFSHGAGPRVDK
ncbi:MAG: hypothetical protein CME26_11895 [Gemmatimonadetes bacterium]|nr:hypothetical protein [Gemmatimonadota bacterium]